jgi:hypothetical protein
MIRVEWKTWDKYPYIAVSNRGEVWDSRRGTTRKTGISNGYVAFTVGSGRKKHKTVRLHRVVCEAFHGPAPQDKPQARHLDGNQLNNHSSNIAWGSQLDNERDKDRHGTRPCGELVKRAVLDEPTVKKIKRMSSVGLSAKSIGDILGFNRGTIAGVTCGRNWKHVCGLTLICLSLSACETLKIAPSENACEIVYPNIAQDSTESLIANLQNNLAISN